MENGEPISFGEVSYFKNRFRGDLFVTFGVIYYFPHTNVESDRRAPLGGESLVEGIGGVGGLIVPYLGALPFGYNLAGLGYQVFKFGRRTFRPTVNRPKIKELNWRLGVESTAALQAKLNEYVAAEKKKPIDVRAENSLPQPMRFEADKVKNLKLGLRLKFETEFDSHDFGFNQFQRKRLRVALCEAGFLK